ncbi:MAG: serine/threonine-protein kinase [Myxococcota bacterium]
MASSKPGLDTQLRGAGPKEDGLEKSMAFSAVRRALLGAQTEDITEDAIGKYRVLERLGAGGMGAVFAAWDPELERRVALKVLTGGREASEEQTLIMREAKAAAQLSHPNVVTVFEVGVAQGRVFLAMEYIRGETLRAWAQTEPSASDRVAVLLAAGRGLAAAHEQGLVHRDFKPDNVLVDDKRQAKVVDFGLAHSTTEALEQTSADAPAEETRGPTLTQTGPRSGTPDYMAPEQLRGRSADARTDQFAFAVTAWELLCGTRPFEDNVSVEAPRGRPVAGTPRGIMPALTKALSEDPAARFASMQALLDALDPAPRAARRNRWLLGGAAALSVGAVAWGSTAAAPMTADVITPCTDLDAQLDGVWDTPSRTAYAGAFTQADPDAGDTLWAEAEPTLDAYATAWVGASTEACLATRVRGEQSDETFTLRTRCLHRRLRAFTALTSRFADLDAAAASSVPSVAQRLPSLDACADPERLAALVPPPPDEAADTVEQLREELASLNASEQLGQYKRSADATPEVVNAAMAVDYRPLHAEAKQWEGLIFRRMGEFEKAQASLEQAELHAIASGHDHLLAEVLGLQALVVGNNRSQPKEGLAIADRAQAVIERVGGDADLSALLAARRGVLHRDAGDLQQAKAAFEDAVSQIEAINPQSVQLGDTLSNLATVTMQLGDLETAVDLQERALKQFETKHGENHPAVGSVVANRATVLRKLGRLDEASESFERAGKIFTASLGETHPNVIALRLNRANLELEREDYELATTLLADVPEQLQKALGEEHPWVGMAFSSRGRCWAERGDHDSARGDYARALAVLEKAAPKSVELGIAYCQHAASLSVLGEQAAARAGFARAYAMFETVLGDELEGHPELESCRALQAEVASAQ